MKGKNAMAKLNVTRPMFCWLFGGLGFHNSEATMTRLMSDSVMKERVLKTFREISPTFSRVFAGYSDWTKEAMDAFADYYDQTFRPAGTTLYLVPGRIPFLTPSFDGKAYAEQVAEKLEYLIRVRGCRKIRYYCLTNELSCGNTNFYFGRQPERLLLFKELHEQLYDAFRRHQLDVGLVAMDASGISHFDLIDWAIENMDEITEVYCAHNYQVGAPAGDPSIYNSLLEAYRGPTAAALRREKRFMLGEFGVQHPRMFFRSDAMRSDVCCGYDNEEEAELTALTLAEEALAVLNSGCVAAAYWTFMDYPDPFLREDGDTPEEHARYECARFSGHGISIRYNKWGILRWNDEQEDWGVRPSFYTLGLLARFLRKGSRVLRCETDTDALRCGAVINPDGSLSVCMINNSPEALETELTCELPQKQPFRIYSYAVGHVPENPFGDLPAWDACADGADLRVTVPPKGMLLLTTDYTSRVPSPIHGIVRKGETLSWDACPDPEHCYYRVYRNGIQIASTVAEYLTRDSLPDADYEVFSVDRWGNCRR